MSECNTRLSADYADYAEKRNQIFDWDAGLVALVGTKTDF